MARDALGKYAGNAAADMKVRFSMIDTVFRLIW